jgi:hypothetical protein
MRDSDTVPAGLSANFEDSRGSAIVPRRQVFCPVNQSCLRYADSQFNGCIEQPATALDYWIALGESQRSLDERPQRRFRFMQCMELRHDPIIARYDDLRFACE